MRFCSCDARVPWLPRLTRPATPHYTLPALRIAPACNALRLLLAPRNSPAVSVTWHAWFSPSRTFLPRILHRLAIPHFSHTYCPQPAGFLPALPICRAPSATFVWFFWFYAANLYGLYHAACCVPRRHRPTDLFPLAVTAYVSPHCTHSAPPLVFGLPDNRTQPPVPVSCHYLLQTACHCTYTAFRYYAVATGLLLPATTSLLVPPPHSHYTLYAALLPLPACRTRLVPRRAPYRYLPRLHPAWVILATFNRHAAYIPTHLPTLSLAHARAIL